MFMLGKISHQMHPKYHIHHFSELFSIFTHLSNRNENSDVTTFSNTQTYKICKIRFDF